MAREPTTRPSNRAGPPKPKKARRRRAKKTAGLWVRALPWRGLAQLGAEFGGLAAAGLILTIAVLGRAAGWFSGIGLASHLLPFAGTVLVLALVLGGAMWLWWRGRGWMSRRSPWFPAGLALLLAVIAAVFAEQTSFHEDLANLKTLVGGRQQAERNTIAHQVYAAYRRFDLNQMRRMIDRAQVYLPVLEEAAAAGHVDPEVLFGVGAAESSFNPRDSKDGGRGLFQITAPPKTAVEFVRKRLSVDRLDYINQRHNALVAAVTLHEYLEEMNGDLFLGLLAYNIGPRNGGLRSIMQQYGARDFVTIQPYLKDLPRDYPIRVLSAALAYRIWHSDGRLLRYEEGSNAVHIQDLGIPGLADAAGTHLFPNRLARAK